MRLVALLLAVGCASKMTKHDDAAIDTQSAICDGYGTVCSFDAGAGYCVGAVCFEQCHDFAMPCGRCPCGKTLREGALPQPPYIYCFCQ